MIGQISLMGQMIGQISLNGMDTGTFLLNDCIISANIDNIRVIWWLFNHLAAQLL